MADQYLRQRQVNQDISGNLSFATTQTTLTLVTPRNTHNSVFLQQVVVYITISAAQSLTFQDVAGRKAAAVTTTPGADTKWVFDFGPNGFQFTEGSAFEAVFSAAGLAGSIEWYGYQRQTSTIDVTIGA